MFNLTFLPSGVILIPEKGKGVPNMMMQVYSGFDALTRDEYDEIMESLAIADMQNELAERAAEDYFEHELEQDALEH